MDKIFRIYSYVFAKPFFRYFNMVLFKLSLRGLGFYNYQTKHLTGEYYFITKIFNNKGKKIIFDVGAHIGNYSIDLSTNSEAQIYSFEASPITYQTLKKNTSNIKNILPMNFAVSDTLTNLKLYDYEDRDYSSHATLYKSIIIQIHKAQTKEYNIETTTIDNFAEKHQINMIDLLKIDVEGHEFKVLQGAKKLLSTRSIKTIQFEFNEFNSISRVFFKDIFEMLSTDYEIFRLLPKGLLKISKYTPTECEIFGFSNYVAQLKDVVL